MLVVNASYARLFGNYFDSLLEGGMAFNWVLFLAVSVAILFFKVNYLSQPQKRKRGIRRRLKEWTRLQLYLIRHSPTMKRPKKTIG